MVSSDLLILFLFFQKKLFQTEDLILEQKKEYEEKLSSLGSIVRMIELKAKNASDHGNLLVI